MVSERMYPPRFINSNGAYRRLVGNRCKASSAHRLSAESRGATAHRVGTQPRVGVVAVGAGECAAVAGVQAIAGLERILVVAAGAQRRQPGEVAIPVAVDDLRRVKSLARRDP